MKYLTYRMVKMLQQGTAAWAPLPQGHGCTSRTLEGLETRALIKMDFNVDGCGPGWRWRLTDAGVDEAAKYAS